jgi:hypothetical protein
MPDPKQLSLFDEPPQQNSSSQAENHKEEQPDWRLYERIVAAVEAQYLGIEMSIIPNARIIGCLSGKKRQIDALLDARWGDDISRRIIVDAKRYKTKVDIKDVESLEGMMRDCGAKYGILICPKGCTEGARRRAQDAITIKILALDEVDAFFSSISFDKCLGECRNRHLSPSRTGVVFWHSPHGLFYEDLWSILVTGKCDVCHNFHVFCQECGEKFALRDGEEYKCNCKRTWYTLIDEGIDDETGKMINTVRLLLCANNNILCFDQRRLI